VRPTRTEGDARTAATRQRLHVLAVELSADEAQGQNVQSSKPVVTYVETS